MRRWRVRVAVAALGRGGDGGVRGAGRAGRRPDRRLAARRSGCAVYPKVGDCYVVAEPSSYLTSYQPGDCTRQHHDGMAHGRAFFELMPIGGMCGRACATLSRPHTAEP